MPGIITLLGGTLFVILRWLNAGHRHLSSFLVIGRSSVTAGSLPPGLIVTPGSGYDGQFYYRLALAPWNFHHQFSGIVMDLPVRFQRIGYPAVVWASSLGHRSAVPLMMVIVNVLALGALGLACGRWAQQLGRHALWGLLPATYFGFVYTLSRDLTELLAAALLVGGLVALRNKNFALAALSLSAAVLTRETALIFVASYAVVRIRSMLRTRNAFCVDDVPWIGPLAVFVLWQVIVRLSAGVWPLTSDKSSNFDLPFRAIIQMIPIVRHAGFNVIALMAISSIALVTLVVSAVMVLRTTSASSSERLAFVVALILVICLSANIWLGDPVQFRTLNDLWIYGAGIIIGSRRTTLLIASSVAGAAALSCVSLWKISTV